MKKTRNEKDGAEEYTLSKQQKMAIDFWRAQSDQLGETSESVLDVCPI